MNKIYRILIIGFLILGCKNKNANKNVVVEEKVEFNQKLVNELQKMFEIDQIAANAFPTEDYSHLTQSNWEVFKDSVYRKNQKHTKEILLKYGYVGYDLAGKQGSRNFWLIVQHSDHNPEFQKDVLKKMKLEVDKGNADQSSYGLLVDRVKLNTGQNQIYGTQVTFNQKTGQAYARKLEDSANVNERRKLIGLEPIEIYLNQMSEMHFEMNKDVYAKIGITEPKLYKTK
jgi:hypothetical protein